MKRVLLFVGLFLSFSFVTACQVQRNMIQAVPTNTGELISQEIKPTPTQIISSTRLAAAADKEDDNEKTADFYASVDGRPTASGSIDDPWDLQTALDHPDPVQPGDTIWLRGGVYVGEFQIHLKGEPGKPVVLRQYPGERAILSGEGLMLDIQDTYWADLWGFEIAALENTRDPENRPVWGFGVRTHQGLPSNHIRFINMIIHDVPAQGFGWWIANTDSEIYGCLIYYNGVNQLDHGIYMKNQTGEKIVQDNFIFDNASHGIHAYSSTDDTLTNITVMGNTVFNNGSTGYDLRKDQYAVLQRNILIGGYNMTKNAAVLENYTYYPGDAGESFNLGYRIGSIDSVVKGNYFMGGGITLGGIVQDLIFEDNIVYSKWIPNGMTKNYPANQYYDQAPTTNMVFLRQNQFEPNRANLTIYNWEGWDKVYISNEMIERLEIKKGDKYKLHNVQDYFVDVIEGIYDGDGIVVPMIDHSVSQPIGLDFKPPSTFPEFGAFVLVVEP